MGKKNKEHRKRVAKRNEEINIQKRKMMKAQEEFMRMIEKEKAAGKFDNNPIIGSVPPMIDLGEGPQI